MTNEPLILHVETATTVCSVALSRGASVLGSRELDEGYTHAENLHVFIGEVLEECGLTPAGLHAIALSSGPGSYTGLRIGSSTAKGLCFALGIPLIAISTLRIMAAATKQKQPDALHLCPMIDAGRMEVYTAVFDNDLGQVKATEALVLSPESLQTFVSFPAPAFSGTGMEKARDLIAAHTTGLLTAGIRPSALHMPRLALSCFQAKEFTEIADFEPFYLKNFVAGKKKRPV